MRVCHTPSVFASKAVSDSRLEPWTCAVLLRDARTSGPIYPHLSVASALSENGRRNRFAPNDRLPTGGSRSHPVTGTRYARRVGLFRCRHHVRRRVRVAGLGRADSLIGPRSCGHVLGGTSRLAHRSSRSSIRYLEASSRKRLRSSTSPTSRHCRETSHTTRSAAGSSVATKTRTSSSSKSLKRRLLNNVTRFVASNAT